MKKILIVTGVFLVVVFAIVLETWRQQNPAARGPCWHMLLSWPEGITGWAIIATLIVIGWQSYETARSADIANRTLLSTMRPRLIIHRILIHRGTRISIMGVPDADPWRIDFDVVNLGQSMALVTRRNFTSNRIEDDIPDFTVEEEPSVPLSLEPGQKRTDLPPISQPLITRVSRFWFGFEIISQPPSRLCKCGKRSVLSTFAWPACRNSSGVL